MAAIASKSPMVAVLRCGVLCFSVATLTLGAGAANADPNDPGMEDVRGNGVVSSQQADSTAGANRCSVDPGTLGTSAVHSADHGAPMQRATEAGPSWVGSDGWQAIGLSPSNPWGGNFDPRYTKTGPQCSQGSASGFG